MKAVVAQVGAREHFLAARALHHQGALAQLVVDWYAPRPVIGRGMLAVLGSNRAASALAAGCDQIPRRLVRSFPGRSLFWKWKVRRLCAAGRDFEAFDQTDAAFARAVAQLRLPEHDVYFGYSYASLEMLELERKRGVFTVLDQIDPGPAEHRLVAEEMVRHPHLAGPPGPFPQRHFDRARREWQLADLIVVNSEWSRAAIIAEGADPAKIEILPLAYEMDTPSSNAGVTTNRSKLLDRPLRVLWLGQVNVRKGIHYLLEAARFLAAEHVEFWVAGPLGIRREVMAKSSKNVRWLGSIPRGEAPALYRLCDIFALPTLSDGFALTQLEALAHGLPVIVTPNCGRVVEEGKSGFIIPARDSGALVNAILRFVRQPELALEMAPGCQTALKAYSVRAYGQNLLGIINGRRGN